MDNRADSRYRADEDDLVPAPDPSPDALELADQRIAACDNQQAPELDLNGLGLQAVPPGVRILTWLRTLRLQSNGLRELPEWIDELVNLRELDLRGNPLEVLTPSLGRLSQLKLLLIDGSNAPGNSRIVTVAGDILGRLTSLDALGLTKLTLPEVPTWIRELKNLERLWLFSNSLTSLPEWLSELSHLRVLNVRNNRLAALPGSLRTLKSLEELHVEGNPDLRLPEEITASRHAPRVLDYYLRTAAPGATSRPLNEFKLILVGRGAVGKTTLVEKLVTGRFLPTTLTPGINITKWTLKIDEADVRAHIWDFGGQEIMHGTHRFFMTERALYLVLITGREDSEDRDAEHWLSLVRSFAGDAPIIVVLHKWNEKRFELNRARLRDKYGQGIVFEEVDSRSGHGIAALQHRICELASSLPGLRVPWPAQWWRIKEQLPALKESWLPYQDFCDFVRDHGVTEPKDQDALAESLHDLGLMLSYRKDETLRNFGVLNPQWVTRGIYGMLNSPALREARGLFTVKSFGEVLNRQAYPEKLHPYLVGLMRKFLLCFPLDDRGEKYLMPELLTKEEPDLERDFPASKCLGFIYRYESVLPEGILQQFIVQAYVHREPQHVWRTGVVLERNHCRALVRGDVQGRQITIRVVGADAIGRRELLAVIREYFDRQHDAYKKLPVTRWVPVYQHPEVQLDYEELRAFELNREEWIPKVIDGRVVKLPVKSLLEGVDMPGVRSGLHRGMPGDDQGRSPLSLVISHASTDETFSDQLRGTLVPYEVTGQLTVWAEKLITAGQDWEREIFAKLDQADIVVLLLSSDYLSSYHCMDKELARAVERHERGECEVVPLVVRACRFDKLEFLGKIQPIQPNDKAIDSHVHKDEAWVEVTKQIDHVIERLKKK